MFLEHAIQILSSMEGSRSAEKSTLWAQGGKDLKKWDYRHCPKKMCQRQ